MHYKFPVIQHLDDVRPAIEGRDEFIIAEREWGFVVNYLINFSDTFPPIETAGGSAKMRDKQSRLKAVRRECRGILFYPDGRIMARRYQKFFNVGEKDETQPYLIDFTQPHVILEKIDGSMITPLVLSNVPDERFCRRSSDNQQIMRVGEMRWATKMGLTDVSAQVDTFVAANPRYEEFSRWCIDYCGATPIFEWASRKQRIVIDFPVDRLILTAVRETISGNYKSYDWMKLYGEKYGIDVVNAYAGTSTNMENLVSETRDLTGAEGWVVRFDDGYMVKVKSEEYIRFHKTKDSITLEKNVIDLIVNEKIDDTKSFMLDEDRVRVSEFEDKFWHGFNATVTQMELDLKHAVSVTKGDRKTFALGIGKNLTPITRQIMFACWDGERNVRHELLGIIKKNVNTATKVDSVRALWGGHSWNYNFEDDN